MKRQVGVFFFEVKDGTHAKIAEEEGEEDVLPRAENGSMAGEVEGDFG